jgi:hypothetical protein
LEVVEHDSNPLSFQAFVLNLLLLTDRQFISTVNAYLKQIEDIEIRQIIETYGH